MKEILLNGYKAEKLTKKILSLGTWGSYGEEYLKITHDDSWNNMDIFAVFVLPDKTRTRVMVGESGIIQVPAEATSIYLPLNNPGRIVFEGYGNNVKRLSTEIIYICLDHAPTDGEDTKPITPSEFEQYLEKVQNIIDLSVPTEGEINQVLTKTENGNEWKDPQVFSQNIDIISGGKAPEVEEK